ncbi:MAG: response regulator, partial [Chloroflexi bacterium]|nr:response regulator [Chloroflexota bacterium]
VLTFAAEIGAPVAQECKQVAHSEIVLLAKDHVVVSTLGGTNLDRTLAEVFHKLAASSQPAGAVLNEERYWALAGHFATGSGMEKLGYLLLSSYETPLRELRTTQLRLFSVSLFGILLSSLLVWFLVRTITQPLRQLRDGAEAVGRGDFSHHVPAVSRDECGDLAAAFNQMTENLKTSRAQLEKTVETLKTTQAQLVQSEKLSAIGEFVAGVTHELNNPLTAVIGFAELLQQSKIGEQHRRHLEFIVLSAQRCHKIVQSLLSFARQHPPERKWVQLNDLVETTLSFVNYELHTSNIQVMRQLDPLLPKVLADPHQLQQVLLNIINNARQAIEDYRPDGQLRVSTGSVEGWARVTFQDNGPGISEENLSRIFNPFFTTKEVGKGTGLGLSLSYGIIQEHGGTIAARSQEGEGTAFIIDLPIARDGAGRESTEAGADARPAVALEGRGRRVLLIDDEESILELAREILAASGYQVETALDGEKALQQLRHTRYDLILCDWKMPGLSGQQFYHQLQVANPLTAARVVFMTGDVVNEKTQQFLLQNGKVCLSKPFSLDEFRAAVRTVIEAT